MKGIIPSFINGVGLGALTIVILWAAQINEAKQDIRELKAQVQELKQKLNKEK